MLGYLLAWGEIGLLDVRLTPCGHLVITLQILRAENLLIKSLIPLFPLAEVLIVGGLQIVCESTDILYGIKCMSHFSIDKSMSDHPVLKGIHTPNVSSPGPSPVSYPF